MPDYIERESVLTAIRELGKRKIDEHISKVDIVDYTVELTKLIKTVDNTNTDEKES